MDRIPPEILASIVEYVASGHRDLLPALATVSRTWQTAVEHNTFRSLQLSSSDLNVLEEAFQGDKVSRRVYLRSVGIHCVFPERPTGCCEVTRTIDREHDSQIWSKFMARLFSVLADITTRCENQTETVPPVSLTLLEAFRGKSKMYGRLRGVHTRCDTAEHSPREVMAATPRPGTIKLYGSELLPVLLRVSSFEGHGWGESKFLHPAWIGQITRKLVSLQHLTIYLEDAYDWGCNQRKKYQSGMHFILLKYRVHVTDSLDLTNSITNVPPTLETLHLRVWTHELMNEDVPIPCLSMPASGSHVYDRMLHHVSMFNKLRGLYLVGPLTVSSTLFHHCENRASAILFPALEEFALEFTPQTSDGFWLFLRDDVAFATRLRDSDDEEDSSEEEDNSGFWVYGDLPVRERQVSDRNKYRSLPNPDTFTSFLVSAARVCARMPRVRQFSLKLNNNEMNQQRLHYDFVDRVFELWFLAAGQTLERFNNRTENPVIPLDTEIAHHNRLYLRVGDYMPNNEILESWKHVIGVDGKLKFLLEEYCEFATSWGWKRMQYTRPTLH